MNSKILLVEDDFITSDEIRERLSSLKDFEFETAFNGDEAVQKAATFEPDLILMDINLGDGMDGIEATARIQHTSTAPVIYLTAYGDDTILTRAKMTKPYGYIFKPFDERELQVAIEIALNKHDAEQQMRQALHASQQHERNIAELLGATHAVLDIHDFEETARYVFDACKRSIGAKAGYVALLSPDEENNDLLFLDDGGLPCTVDPNLPMPVRGLRAEAYRSGKVVYENNFMHSQWAHFMPEGHVTLPNVLFAPLSIDGKTVGVLGLSNKDGDFTEYDAQLAAAFGEYAAIALRNSNTLETLQAQNRQLQELNATKDTFFSIIAHDLRNPFLGIVAGTEVLGRYLQTNEDRCVVEMSREIQSATQVVAKLLENLLTWARLQQGKIPCEPQEIELALSMNSCIILLHENAVQKRISLVNSVAADTRVYADNDMLGTIFRNLISNAIKFTPEGGTITISAQEQGEMVEVRVADTGIGIPVRKLSRLFKVGERNVSSRGTGGETGSGLGLILCREFVEQQGGRIWVESEEGRGSTFAFTLPIAQR